jgi:hypothetical protein
LLRVFVAILWYHWEKWFFYWATFHKYLCWSIHCFPFHWSIWSSLFLWISSVSELFIGLLFIQEILIAYWWGCKNPLHTKHSSSWIFRMWTSPDLDLWISWSVNWAFLLYCWAIGRFRRIKESLFQTWFKGIEAVWKIPSKQFYRDLDVFRENKDSTWQQSVHSRVRYRCNWVVLISALPVSKGGFERIFIKDYSA